MDFTIIFKRLGYPKHTDSVYKLLLQNKEPLSVTVMARQVQLSRMIIYRCLASLVANGLVVKNNFGKRIKYIIGSPHLLQQEIQIADKHSGALLEPYIKIRGKDVPQTVRFLHGQDGIRAAFDDVITHTPSRETFFRYTSEKDLEKVNRYLAPDYRKRRDKKKLERMVISNIISGVKKSSRLERFIRFIPEDVHQFEQNIIQLIYGDRISIIDLNTEEVLIIESKLLADFQKSLFQTLYKRLAK